MAPPEILAVQTKYQFALAYLVKTHSSLYVYLYVSMLNELFGGTKIKVDLVGAGALYLSVPMRPANLNNTFALLIAGVSKSR